MRRARHLIWAIVAMLAVGVCAACGQSGTAAPAFTPVRAWLAQRTVYIAHRGGEADWPEGSVRAYTRSADWNPGLAFEVPVRRTSDGVWVVSEDPTTARVFGTDLTIATSTWATLSALRSRSGNQPPARLEPDVLSVAGPSRVLFVDDKSDTDAAGLLDLLDAHGGRTRFVIKSFARAQATAAEAHKRGYLTWGYYFAADLAQFAATESRFDLLGLPWSAPAADYRTMLHTGKRVIAHVVATAAQAHAALAAGATGLMVSGVEQVVPR